MPSPLHTSALLRSLYVARHDPEELALAAHLLYGKPPEDWAEFLDFFVLEWVDPQGYTAVDRAVLAGDAPPAALRLSLEARTALWVVDGWEGDLVLLRDLVTEGEIAVHAPGRAGELPRKTVLRARVVPEIALPDRFIFSGSPDLYDGLGVIARMDLLRAWQETPEPDALARLSALRRAFTTQREEQCAFVTHFGTNLKVFGGAGELGAELARFVNFLGNDWRFPSLGGQTRAEAHRASKGDEPKVVQIQLGESLKGPGRPGILYDQVQGVHFLPHVGELLDHLAGTANHPEVVMFYMQEPGLPTLEMDRERGITVIPPPGRAVPSLFPGWEGE